MSRFRAIFWCICFTTAFENFVRADDDLRSLEGSNQTLQFDLSRGIELRIANGEARIAVKMSALLNRNEVEEKSTGRFKFKGALKKIGSMLMMAPFMIQMMTLPGTIASIKLSLLRSIFVGKIALLIILYGIIKNSQRSEVVVVHKPEYHQHYHDSHPYTEEDDGNWWGR